MRSLLLSIVLSCLVFYALATMLDSKNQNWLAKLPASLGTVSIIGLCFGYLLALYWGFSRIGHEQRIANFVGIVFSLGGLSFFIAGFAFANGKNEATTNQFDQRFLDKSSKDFEALQSILKQTNLNQSDVKLLTYWDLLQAKDQMAICLQNGQVIGLAINKVKMDDLSGISALTGLRALVLNHCQLKSIENLKLPEAQRLNLKDNLLEDLKGIDAPKVRWLDLDHNPLKSFAGIENIPEAEFLSCEGNTVVDRSALANHRFLSTLIEK